MSKNILNNNEDSGGVTFISRNLSTVQSLNTFTVPAWQSRKPLVSSNRSELQELSFRQVPKKIAVSPEKDSYNHYEIEDDDNLRLSPH